MVLVQYLSSLTHGGEPCNASDWNSTAAETDDHADMENTFVAGVSLDMREFLDVFLLPCEYLKS